MLPIYVTTRSRTKEEIDKKIKEKLDEGYELVGEPRQFYQESTGNLWYAKLKKV